MCVCVCVSMWKILKHFYYVEEGTGEDGGSGVGQKVNGAYIQAVGGIPGQVGNGKHRRERGGVEMRNGEVTRKTVRRP